MNHAVLHIEPDVRQRVARLGEAAAHSASGVEEETGIVYVFRHRDVTRLLHDRRLSGVGLTAFNMIGITDGPLRDWRGELTFTNELLMHRRARQLIAEAFTSVAVERVRHLAANGAKQAIAPLIGHGGDLIPALSTLPMTVMCCVLGLPSSSVRDLARGAHDLGPVFGVMTPAKAEAAAAALDPLLAHVGEVVRRREHSPTNDVISAMLHTEIDGHTLTRSEIIAVIVDLLAGGHDLAAGQIGCSLFALLQRTDIMRLALAEPDLIPSIVAETVRFEPSRDGIPCTILEPIEICDQLYSRGTLLLLCLLTANRDPAAWERPGEFQPRRFLDSPAPRLLSGDTGPSHCLGATLAQITLTEAIRVVLAHMPILLTEPEDVAWTSSLGRGPVNLPVMM
jgi:cytochrome P450